MLCGYVSRNRDGVVVAAVAIDTLNNLYEY